MKRTITLTSFALLALASAGGCLIDDTGGSRGQSNAPSASVPDSGSPVRRESAAKTLNDAEPQPAPADEPKDESKP